MFWFVPKKSSLTGQIDIRGLRKYLTYPLSFGSIEISDFPSQSAYVAKQTIFVRLKDLTAFYVREAVREAACEDVHGTVCRSLLQFLDFFLDSLIVFELGINQRTHVRFNAHYH